MTNLVKKLSPHQQLIEKWTPVLDAEVEGFQPIANKSRRGIMSQLLENSKDVGVFSEAYRIKAEYGLLTEEFPTNVMGTSSSTTGSGPIDTFDPILISLVR